MGTGVLKSIPGAVYAVLIALLCIAPVLTSVFDQPFYLDLLTRALIIAIAAASLNLIIGYGGMISLGHAAFIGIGAYCVGIPAYYDNYNGFVHLGLAIVCSAAFALVTGAISLRPMEVHSSNCILQWSKEAKRFHKRHTHYPNLRYYTGCYELHVPFLD